ncbi:hypothetical protein NHX12_023875 [Muraenolepis orangiensis]|uniref:SET domain-containing protein n=1 Tax=Muraenolepis orangiensis TaxID=630683 RepID=A0A9Q0EKG3_9TELE|nr:hypothetical protein NHX12_023875 [Muraenolepis orangiensis]
MRHATFLDVVGWIDTAWASVTTDTILSGFRKAGLIGADADGNAGPSTALVVKEMEPAPSSAAPLQPPLKERSSKPVGGNSDAPPTSSPPMRAPTGNAGPSTALVVKEMEPAPSSAAPLQPPLKERSSKPVGGNSDAPPTSSPPMRAPTGNAGPSTALVVKEMEPAPSSAAPLQPPLKERSSKPVGGNSDAPPTSSPPMRAPTGNAGPSTALVVKEMEPAPSSAAPLQPPLKERSSKPVHRARKTMNRPPPKQREEPVAKAAPVKVSDWLNEVEEDDPIIISDKPPGRWSPGRASEEAMDMSTHSLGEADAHRERHGNNHPTTFPWMQPGRSQPRDRSKGAELHGGPGVGALQGSSEDLEVPLGALDISAADSLTQSPPHEGSEAGDRLEELPLCSCRMEAPRVDGAGPGPGRRCMATESVNGELRSCTSQTVKGETMRPSSRVPLLLLCDFHRSHMVRHHCCPSCGFFCLAGTFLECCPDQRIAHRFHRGCVTDASEAQEVTILSVDSLTTTTVVTMTASSTTATTGPLALPLPGATPSLATGGGGGGRKPERPVGARMRAATETEPPPAVTEAGEEGVDSAGPSLLLPNGKLICPSALPPGPSRAALQKAILTQDTERRKKLRFHPRQLYPSAKQGEGLKVLLMLMEGVDPTQQPDTLGRKSALHAAAQRGALELCYMLVQAGAVVDAQDKTLRTPLLEAIVNNHLEVTRYLVQSGASVYHTEDDGYTGLHHAAKLGNLHIVHLLLETGQVDINAQDSGGWTPIIWAAEHKHMDVIRALLSRGADVTIQDKEMNMCLHWASFAGSVDIAELVLNAGCSLSSVNMHGDMPLHIAAREGFLECVTLFLSRGANIDTTNREGDTPLSLAPPDTPVWVALQINRKLRRGVANRALRTERIVSSDVAQGYENLPIPCVNAVDEDGCPSDYKYVSENCETSAMNIDRNITHLQHCSCVDDCSSSNCLCGQLSIRCWYDKDQRLLQEFNKIEPPLIFEVVQAGIKVRLQLYRTENMGWGVRALQDIPQGSFICEYVGELISDAEADVREDDSYLFDLDNKDLRFPRIAFFSSRDIHNGQELGFDYGDRFWDIKSKYFTCQCGSEKCKHSAEAIAVEQSRLARLEACSDSMPDLGMNLPGNA